MKKLIALLAVLLLVWPACAGAAPFTGTITAADKYGNVGTDLAGDTIFAEWALGDLLTVVIGEKRITAPLAVRYSDVNQGEAVVFVNGEGQVCFSVNYGSFQETYAAQPGTAFTLELLQAGGYLDQFEIRNLAMSESRDDYASDEAFANFRPVIEGVLYRGASPILPEKARSVYAMNLMQAAGVRTVLNLAQSPEELAEMDLDYGDMAVVAVGMAVDVTAEDFAPKLKEALTFLLEHEGPYYIHCNEGKDRAGIVCALIEGLMGFTPRQIVADYMQSYVNYYGVEEGTEKYILLAQQIESIMETMLGAPMQAESLSARAETYLRDTVGVDPEALRAKLNG